MRPLGIIVLAALGLALVAACVLADGPQLSPAADSRYILINGQSNAVSRIRDGQAANGLMSNHVLTYAAGWQQGEADDWQAANHIGQWPLLLGNLLYDTFGQDTVILNGAEGSKPISYFLPDEDDHSDQATNYGRLYSRVVEAGAAGLIETIIWFQGESDAIGDTDGEDYISRFETLRAAWLADYPNVNQIVVIQIQPGCGADEDDIAEIMTAQAELPDVTLIETVDIPHSTDECHYNLTGSAIIAGRVFGVLVHRVFMPVVSVMEED